MPMAPLAPELQASPGATGQSSSWGEAQAGASGPRGAAVVCLLSTLSGYCHESICFLLLGDLEGTPAVAGKADVDPQGLSCMWEWGWQEGTLHLPQRAWSPSWKCCSTRNRKQYPCFTSRAQRSQPEAFPKSQGSSDTTRPHVSLGSARRRPSSW